MTIIYVYFFDGNFRTQKTHLLTVYSKYAVWFNNSYPPVDAYGKVSESEPFPKNISLEEAGFVFDGLMEFHQNGNKSKKDLGHFLINHGCQVSKLPDWWSGYGWTGEYCHYFNVEIN